MKIVGSIYRDMVVSAACCLDNNKEIVNNLNVLVLCVCVCFLILKFYIFLK